MTSEALLHLVPRATAVLVYDVTQSLMVPGRSFEPWAADGLPLLVRLLDACRHAGVLVIYGVAASGIDTSGTPPAIAQQPDDLIIHHQTSGAVANTELEPRMRAEGRDTLLITGMAVDRGCNVAARDALARKLHPIVVRDVCFTRDITESPVGPVPKADVARAHLAALHRLGVGIATVEEVVAALKLAR
ncbi:MAG: isochorismatase hydrolase [Chloroflexi bacterium]|nr:isochorismatase hydrolase [Chloroflexota bacterium]